MIKDLYKNKEAKQWRENHGDLEADQDLGERVYTSRLIGSKSRSKDEHPLVFKDVEMIKSNFKNVNIKYYGFLTLVFFPFYNSKDSKFFKALVRLDQMLFRIKIFKYFAWYFF